MSSGNFFAQPPPHPHPPLLGDGTISPEWFIWLYQLFKASAALQDLQKLEAFEDRGSSQALTLALQRATTFEAQSGPSARDLAQLRAQLAIDSDGPLALAKLEEIKKLVFAMEDGREPKRLYTGTHAQRLLTYPLSGAVFYETDTFSLFVAVNGVWDPVSGGATPPTTAVFTMRGINGNGNVLASDFTVFEFGAGASTLTLPDATTVTFQIFCLKAVLSVGPVTIATTGGQTIDGQASATLLADQAIWVQSDGANWKSIAFFIGPLPWTSWTPVATPSGAMTYTGVSTAAFYQKWGKTVHVRMYLTGTIGGTPTNTIAFTLPFAQLDNFQTLACAIENNGIFNSGSVWPIVGGVDVFLPAGAVYSAGTTIFVLQGTYEAA